MVHADTTMEIAVRAFHAICKIVANGLPPTGTIDSENWNSQSISRGLTEEEAKCAAKIALWIETPAKKSASDSRATELELAHLLAKYMRFKTTRSEGQARGVQTNQKKKCEAEVYFRPIIEELINKNPHQSDADIARSVLTRAHKITRCDRWLRNLAKSCRKLAMTS